MAGTLAFGAIIAAIGVFLSKSSSLKWPIKWGLNAVLALILLCVLEIVGQEIGFHLPINGLTVLVVAALGVPGIMLLAVLNFLLV